MTSGGYTKAEAWNLQLQGRVKRFEDCLNRIDKFIEAVAPTKLTKELDSIRKEIRASLSTATYPTEGE